MGKKYLLIGQPAAGKTTVAKILSGEKIPEGYDATMGSGVINISDGFLLGLFNNSQVIDTGGNDKSETSQWGSKMLGADATLVFFNGNKFVEELDNPKEGGPIGSMMRHPFSKALDYVYDAYKLRTEDGKIDKKYKEILDKYDFLKSRLLKNIYFIATYADQCPNMHSDILRKLNDVQTDYCRYGVRYFFKEYMLGHLFCIDATNKDQVWGMFETIKKLIEQK